MKSAEVEKAMGLLKQAMACLEGYSGEGGDEDTEEMAGNSPEGEDDDLPMKSFKMKLSKYKG